MDLRELHGVLGRVGQNSALPGAPQMRPHRGAQRASPSEKLVTPAGILQLPGHNPLTRQVDSWMGGSWRHPPFQRGRLKEGRGCHPPSQPQAAATARAPDGLWCPSWAAARERGRSWESPQRHAAEQRPHSTCSPHSTRPPQELGLCRWLQPATPPGHSPLLWPEPSKASQPGHREEEPSRGKAAEWLKRKCAAGTAQ